MNQFILTSQGYARLTVENQFAINELDGLPVWRFVVYNEGFYRRNTNHSYPYNGTEGIVVTHLWNDRQPLVKH